MVGKTTRRAFLVGSAAIVGGVAFGFYQVAKPLKNPLVPGEGEVTLNPYLLVKTDGIYIITPRAEMGQGVQTTLAALVAEEMDLSWADVKVLHGPASSTYYNGLVVAGGLPFAEYGDNPKRDMVEGVMSGVGKVMGMQITGGSTSIRDGYLRMRRAGASARLVLMAAASERLKQPMDKLRTERSAVVAPDGTRIPFTDLAKDAAQFEAPPDPELKQPEKWHLLGTSLPRLDMVSKCTGTADFAIDQRPEGMLHAAVRMNPRLGGTMSGFNADKALKMRGVSRVVDLGSGLAVVADNTWRALQALDAIDITWDDAPYPNDTDGIFAEIAAAFDGKANSTLRDDGDVETALQSGDSIEAEYRLPYLAHATMEPMNAVAEFTGGQLNIWCGTQAPLVVRDAAAKVTGVAKSEVVVHTTFMGGGFGRRAEADFTTLAARVAMEFPGVPVQLLYSREEDMRHDFYRPGIIARVKGTPGDEVPKAMSADIAGASLYKTQTKRVAGISPPGPDKLLVEGAFDQPYGIENYRVRGYISQVAVPLGAWRSVGYSHNAFVTECFLDELAAARGLDPLAMRLRLMKDQSREAVKVLETVADMADWSTPVPSGKGRGVAFSWSFGSPTAQIIEISQTPDGIRLDKVWCTQDVGAALDPRNIEAQIMSGITFGLTAAIYGEVTFADGQVNEGNFDDYQVLRIDQMPQIESQILQGGGHLGGVGEPATPPAAPALANAIFSLTGQRIRTLPLRNAVDFA